MVPQAFWPSTPVTIEADHKCTPIVFAVKRGETASGIAKNSETSVQLIG